MKSSREAKERARPDATLPRAASRAARNAWRHGLTVPPTDVDEEVVAVCRLLAAEAGTAALLPSRETVELARADVQVQRVSRQRSAAMARLSGLIMGGKVVGTPRERGYRALLQSFNVPDDILDNPAHPIHRVVLPSGNLAALDPVTIVLEELRLLVRYRQEAEAWRHSALHAWLNADDGLV